MSYTVTKYNTARLFVPANTTKIIIFPRIFFELSNFESIFFPKYLILQNSNEIYASCVNQTRLIRLVNFSIVC